MTLPVVIVGGGLAGAAAACLLTRAGRRPIVLERDRAPTDKICGEFVSAEAIAYLDRLGVPAARMGSPTAALRLVRKGRAIETKLPFRGVGLSRRTLDAALLERASVGGAEVRRGWVAGAVRDGSIDVHGNATVAHAGLLLATGKHDLHGIRRQPANAPEDLLGFKTYFRLRQAQAAAAAGHVEVILFPDCYAGLQTVEEGRVNLCLLVRRERLQRVGGTWEALLADLMRDDTHLARRLDGAISLLDRPLTIYRVPYGFVHRPSAADPDGVFRVGDQAAVIPSFAGDGMAIALHSAALAVQHVLAGRSAESYHRRVRQDLAGQIRRASAVYSVCKHRFGQAALMALGSAWPAGLGSIAKLTRVPGRALAAMEVGA